MTEHKPGLHCHHDTVAAECTLCTYLAMEKAHNETIELLIALEAAANETTPQVGEESGSPRMEDPQN